MPTRRVPDTPFWVEPDAVAGERLRLDLGESRHLLRVHRAEPGTPFVATDGTGRWFTCVLESHAGGRVVAWIGTMQTGHGELGGGLVLLAGLPDPAATERLVSLAVPLGVTQIVLIRSAHAETWNVTPVRRDRLERICRAGVKQARRSVLPVVDWAESVSAALEPIGAEARWLADPEGAPGGAAAELRGVASVALAVGPPGGFSRSECEDLAGARFQSISLGPSRLTTEAAAAAGLALVRNALIRK